MIANQPLYEKGALVACAILGAERGIAVELGAAGAAVHATVAPAAYR